MQRKSSALLFVALGAALIAAPNFGNLGSEGFYAQAFAEKGGNGKGNGNQGSNGKSGGTHSAGNGSAATNGKQKQIAVSDPLAPAHPSMLGRWNAAKPIDHPSIQAHIRNGNFDGTMGMIAAYAQAQTAYNSVQAQIAATQTTLNGTDLATLEGALDQALIDAGYANIGAYETAVTGGAPKVDAVEAAKQAIQDYNAAEALVAAHELALDDLATAEANMAFYSNRAPWEEIRETVRAKMDLDPAEDDLAEAEPSTETTQP